MMALLTATRVAALSEANTLNNLLQFIFEFHGREFVSTENLSEVPSSDFVFQNAENSAKLEDFEPTILFIGLQDEYPEIFALISRVTPGGIVIFPENSQEIQKAIDSCQNYFRKIPYQETEFVAESNSYAIKTGLGDLPLNITDEKLLRELTGIQLLCQQLGIQEENFQEALMNFEA